jgi:hypothetical protein
VGIAVGVAVILLALATLFWYLRYRRETKKFIKATSENRGAQEMADTSQVLVEMEAKHGQTEMNARSPVYEIGDGR